MSGWGRTDGDGNPSLRTGIRYEARALRRSPLWAGLAAGTVATGIVFATLVLALFEATATELVPYPDPDRLYHIEESNGQIGAVADPTLRLLQARTSVFSAIGAWGRDREANLNRPDAEPSVIRKSDVVPGTFAVFGYGALLGRAFESTDEVPGGEAAAILAHGFWIREFGADPGVLGAPLTVDGREARIVGVMPSEVRLPSLGSAPSDTDVWMAAVRTEAMATDPVLRYHVAARPAEGVDLATARAAAEQAMTELRASIPLWRTDPSWHVRLEPIRSSLEGDGPAALRMLAAASLLLLVLAGANLVALTLARLRARGREFALHAALGAGPGVIGRRLTIQNLLVGAIGSMLAVSAAAWLVRAVRQARPAWIPGAEYASLSPASVAVTVGLALLLCGGVGRIAGAAVVAGDAGPQSLVRGSARGRRWRLVSRGLVLVETGMVVSLAIGAGLLVRSFGNLSAVDTALDLEERIAIQVAPPPGRYPDSESVRRLVEGILAGVEDVPGISSAAVSTAQPLTNTYWNFVIVEGVDPADAELPPAQLEEVTVHYFETVGLDVLEGRGLLPRDYGDGAESVGVINEALAGLFEDREAIGRTLRFTEGPTIRVVGVVEDVPSGSLESAASPRLYVADLDLAMPWPVRGRWFAIHSSPGAGPQVALDALEAATAAVDPALPLNAPIPFSEIRSDLLAGARFRTLMFGVLGLVALLLGTAGIYGVVTLTVGAATRETGIRLALGASRSGVFRRTFVREGAAVLAGMLLGVVAAWQLGVLMAGFLYGVRPVDAATYLTAVGGVLIVAALAIGLPAFRAAGSDPLCSLRAE